MLPKKYIEEIDRRISRMSIERAKEFLEQSEQMKRIVNFEIDECLLMLKKQFKTKDEKINKFVAELKSLISRLITLDENGVRITHNIINLQLKQVPVNEIKRLLEEEALISELVGEKENKIHQILWKCREKISSYNLANPRELQIVAKFVYNIFKYLLPFIEVIISLLKKYVRLEKEEDYMLRRAA